MFAEMPIATIEAESATEKPAFVNAKVSVRPAKALVMPYGSIKKRKSTGRDKWFWRIYVPETPAAVGRTVCQCLSGDVPEQNLPDCNLHFPGVLRRATAQLYDRLATERGFDFRLLQ
jgi:hypothetical protein